MATTRRWAAASEAAYAMICASFPDRAQVVVRWVDSRLDAADPIKLKLLEECAALVASAKGRKVVDGEAFELDWVLQGLAADIHQARQLDGHVGCRWPYFEVFHWPAVLALYAAAPDVEDAFWLRWGEFLIDAEDAIDVIDVIEEQT